MHKLLIKHNVLTEIANKIEKASNGRHLNEIEIEDKIIYPVLFETGLTEGEIGLWISNLVVEDYIRLFSRDNKKTMLIQMKPKGFAAATSEFFYEEYQKHLIELEKIELEKKVVSSTLLTNKLTWINIGITVLLSGILVWLQFRTDYREQRREQRELRKISQEEQGKLEQSKHDSLYENYLLRKTKEEATFSKSDTTKKS